MLASGVSAQQAAVTPYLPVEQMPDLIKCLPAPPAFDSPEFAYDMMRYTWGKQQRLNPEPLPGAMPYGRTRRWWPSLPSPSVSK